MSHGDVSLDSFLSHISHRGTSSARRLNIKRPAFMKAKKIAYYSLLLALAMALSYLEAQLPSVGIPGVKLGLANIAVVFALYVSGLKAAIPVSLLRVVIVNLLFGSPVAMLYGLSGAVFSLATMTALKRLGHFSPIGVSVAGGVMHNAGQILMAMLLLTTSSLIYYLPVLILSGLISGVLVGFLGGILVKRLRHLFDFTL